MPKIQYLYKTRQGIPGIYAQKFSDILQNMNFSRYYRNGGKFIYAFDPDIIKLNLNYLSGDENYAFEIKCVRAIYYIGREKSRPYLEKLCRHENDVILEMAKRKISKLM